jgi:hypothetical protein
MKSTILAAAILCSLTGALPVLAEAPAPTVKPLAVAVVPIDVEATAQQAVAETPSETAAPVSELAEPQALAGTLSEAAVTTAAPVESQAVPEIPAEAVAPATEMVAEPVVVEAPAEEAAGVMASATDAPRQPCPMGGMGMMRKGMGQAGQGPGGRKPVCDHDGRGQQNVQEQVVRRLDMIEARMVKMEAMLESLMRR